MTDAYASLSEHTHVGTVINLTVADTFYKWVTSAVEVQGIADLVVADAVNDELQIQASGGGLYLVTCSLSFTGTVNAFLQGVVHINGVADDDLGVHRKIQAANDTGTGTIAGLVQLSGGDDLDLRFVSDGNNDSVTIFHVNISAVCILRDK